MLRKGEVRRRLLCLCRVPGPWAVFWPRLNYAGGVLCRSHLQESVADSKVCALQKELWGPPWWPWGWCFQAGHRSSASSLGGSGRVLDRVPVGEEKPRVVFFPEFLSLLTELSPLHFLNWHMIELQCCIIFCCIAKWLNYICIYIHTHIYILFHIIFHHSLS